MSTRKKIVDASDHSFCRTKFFIYIEKYLEALAPYKDAMHFDFATFLDLCCDQK